MILIPQISNVWKYFILLISLSVFITFSINFLFLSESIYYQSFGERLASDRIAKMIEASKEWEWLGYVFVLIVVVIRVCFTTICIYIGIFFLNKKVGFRKLFKVSLLADFVFVLAGITKLMILIFFKDINTISDLQFQPFSILELFDINSIDILFIYPFSLINLFEIFYWLALALLLTGLFEEPLVNSLKTVASSYGIGLLLWVLFVMFLTVNLT